MITFRELRTPSELHTAFTVLRDLRKGLSEREFHEIYENAHRADGYRFLGAFLGESCVGVMGYRILWDYVHGKHLYIDDLVTLAQYRSRRIGSQMLQQAETLARELGCRGLRLSTGTVNRDGMRFYDREGWTCRSVTFKKGFQS